MVRHRNDGLRKRCKCARRKWSKCPHPWHFAFKWNDKHYRFSLDRELPQRITSKIEAEAQADRLRQAIREGTFSSGRTAAQTAGVLTFAEFAEIWFERRGSQLVRPADNKFRLGVIKAFVLPATTPPQTFGEKSLTAITTDDIEAFRDMRKGKGLSPVTVNHDLKLLRKMLNWGIRKGYLERTPFKIGTEAAITLQREIPRARRFQHEDDETRLLKAANPHLHAVIIALLDTCCRLGEILSLQWEDVNLARREITIRAAKEKTRTGRILPISSRLLAVLQMRQVGPGGVAHGPEAYVFGNDVGERAKSVRTAWTNACKTAGLGDLQLRDLRHEAGSRFDEAGVSINYVGKMLGHANLTTTSRYLNIQGRGLHLAMEKLEEHQRKSESVAQTLHTEPKTAPASSLSLADAQSDKSSIKLKIDAGAEGGIRTPTLLRAPAPQAGASASSATSARGLMEIARRLTVRRPSSQPAPPVLCSAIHRPTPAASIPRPYPTCSGASRVLAGVPNSLATLERHSSWPPEPPRRS
jgi:integrase